MVRHTPTIHRFRWFISPPKLQRLGPRDLRRERPGRRRPRHLGTKRSPGSAGHCRDSPQTGRLSHRFGWRSQEVDEEPYVTGICIYIYIYMYIYIYIYIVDSILEAYQNISKVSIYSVYTIYCTLQIVDIQSEYICMQTVFILSNCYFRSYLFLSMHIRSCLSKQVNDYQKFKQELQASTLGHSYLQNVMLLPGLDGPQGKYWPLIQPQEIRVWYHSVWPEWAQLLGCRT